MSVEAPPRAPAPIEDVSSPAEPGEPVEAQAGQVLAAARPEAPPVRTAIAAALAMMGAGWMVGGVFSGITPRLVAPAAVALGVAMVVLSVRSGRAWLQYPVIPVATIAGALLIVRDATGEGSASLPGLVSQALHQGGISQPPIPFDPGWRFLLVVIMAVLGAGSAGLAIALSRPKIAILVPLPIAMVGELVQPPGQEVLATTGAAVLIILGLTVAFGADMRASGVAASARFERRRLARTLAMIAVLAVATSQLPRLTFLFPVSEQSKVIPPQRPEIPPPPPDRPLLRYHAGAGSQVPLRVGVLDVYDTTQQAWLLPELDVSRYQTADNGEIPDAKTNGLDTYNVDIQIEDDTGHVLPSVAGLQKLTGLDGQKVQYDPRTQVVQTPDHILYAGLNYAVTGLRAPSGKALSDLGPAPKEYASFLQAPPVPDAVAALLARAAQDPYDRLQVLRNALYQKVVASGAGYPNVDIPPSLVLSMLDGHEATPYQITAGEALLARWAGVPSRIGFGYYGGDQLPGGWFDIRPKNGSTWLEVYFQGYGWLPIIGTPQQARSSLDSADQNQNPSVHATDDVNLVLHIPVRVTSALQYFEYVRYFVVLVLPWVALALAVYLLVPPGAKALRTLRRRRWAARRPPHARILAAYAAFRDVCNDLAVGGGAATPLEFLDAVETDAEHQELAWLATRAIWGDLRRGVDAYDGDRAAELARSVTQRLLRAQNAMALALAATSRASLRDPYTRDVPNLWFRQRRRRNRHLVRTLTRRLGARFLPRRARRRAAATARG